MDKRSNTSNGFTLVEVLVSMGLMLIFIPFVASMLTNNQLLASYSKHKIQAAYAAKQIIETQRQQAVLHGTIASQSAQVILDTKCNYNNSANYFYGTAVTTVTPAVYTSTSGATEPSNASIDHVVVKITWTEKVFNLKVPMTETYATDIIMNDPMLN